jgi:hypothetical protein
MYTSVFLRFGPDPEESILGYITRIAEANAYDHINWLLREAGEVTLDPGTWSPAIIESLARQTRIDRSVLLKRCYSPADGQRHFFGSRIPESQLELTRRKYCPECLLENCFQSALFDLAVVQICPRHGRRLSSVCPACHRSIKWGAGRLATCSRCNEELVHTPTEIVPP